MKKLLTAVLLCTVLTFSACSVSGNGETDNFAEAAVNKEDTEESFSSGSSSLTKSTSAALTSEISVSPPAETVQKEKPSETTAGTKEEADEQTERQKPFPGETEILITSEREKTELPGKHCLSATDGLQYEDFPNKEDIEPIIKLAFDEYFVNTKVYHHGTDYELEGIPCAIENLSFSEGLYLDFNNDGENESLIVIENDSDQPMTHSTVAVYYKNKTDYRVFDLYADGVTNHLYAFIYGDCTDFMVESFMGSSGQAFTVYSYDKDNNSFKEEFYNGKGSVYADDGYIVGYSWYTSGLNSEPFTYYIRTEGGYALVGTEEIEKETLLEKLPEAEKLIEAIEDYYGEEINCIKTVGYMGFYIFVGDKYITARIQSKENNILYTNFQSYPADWFRDHNESDGEVIYGLCLL